MIDRPEIWAGLTHFRNNMVDNNQSYVEYLLRAQHQQEWQYLSTIMIQKGDLQRFMDRVATDLGINWKYESYRFKLTELPHVVTTTPDEANEQDQSKESNVEPFLKFIKEETGY